MEEQRGANSLKDDRHELFCHEYLKDLNITQAAIRAGFSSTSAKQHGSKVFNRPEVKDRIDYLMLDRKKILGIDAFYVLNNLKTIAERCMQAEEVVDRDGEKTGEYKFDATNAIKANELLGKHIGMFNDKIKHEHTGADGKPISMNLEVVFTDESNQSTN